MSTKEGKIIAVVGSMASGKSYLVRHLKNEYRLRSFHEGESADFPAFVKRNLGQHVNGLQSELFFYNQTIEQYLEALKLKRRGLDVILDTYWLTNLFFLKTALPDGHERWLFETLIRNTGKIFPPPDVIVFLDAPEKLIAERLVQRGRSFEKGALPVALQVSREHRLYFADPRNRRGSRIIVENSATLDLRRLARRLGLQPKKA